MIPLLSEIFIPAQFFFKSLQKNVMVILCTTGTLLNWKIFNTESAMKN